MVTVTAAYYPCIHILQTFPLYKLFGHCLVADVSTTLFWTKWYEDELSGLYKKWTRCCFKEKLKWVISATFDSYALWVHFYKY